MNEALLDARGLNCPIPVLKANRLLRSMAAGNKLRVLTTDRASIVDFQVFCRETGHVVERHGLLVDRVVALGVDRDIEFERPLQLLFRIRRIRWPSSTDNRVTRTRLSI